MLSVPVLYRTVHTGVPQNMLTAFCSTVKVYSPRQAVPLKGRNFIYHIARRTSSDWTVPGFSHLVDAGLSPRRLGFDTRPLRADLWRKKWHWDTFLGTFVANFNLSVPPSFCLSVYLSVCLFICPHETTRPPLDRFS